MGSMVQKENIICNIREHAETFNGRSIYALRKCRRKQKDELQTKVYIQVVLIVFCGRGNAAPAQ